MEYLLIVGIFVTIVMVYHILFNNDVEVEDDYINERIKQIKEQNNER